MLVALALSTVVISAVYGAIHLHWTVRTASERHVQTARRLQGVVQDLTYDLRSCRQPSSDHAVGDDEADAEAAGWLGESLLVPESDFSERVLQFETALENVRLIDFVGRSDALLLTASTRNPRFPDSDTAEDAGRASARGVRQIVWLVNAGHGVRLPFGVSDTKRYDLQFRGGEELRGLVRLEIPAPDRAPRQLHEITRQNSSWHLIDATVAQFRLRFFDGRQWLSAWDSERSGRLPQAVEVSLTHGRSDHRSATNAAGPTRVVIRVPQAGGAR